MRRVEEILSRRSDLSTFLVHLTRTKGSKDAKARLMSILSGQPPVLKAEMPMGHAHKALEGKGLSTVSQRCVAFTETPLEHVELLVGQIEGRSYDFERYGVAITKKQGRKAGENPVWYVDITPSHPWLSNHINELVDEAISRKTFELFHEEL